MSTIKRRDCMGMALAGLAGWPVLGHAADAPATAAPAAAGQVEIEGFKFEPTATVAGKPLLLNGATVSLILSVRTTVVALYLPHKQTTPEAALAEPGAKRLCFYSMREVSAKDLSNTFLDRLRQNAASEEIAANFIAIAQFGSAFSNRNKLVRGDFVVMDFNPATNLTEMTLNGQKVGDAMQGESFFRMLMKIWMGPKVRPATRRGLLGDSNATPA